MPIETTCPWRKGVREDEQRDVLNDDWLASQDVEVENVLVGAGALAEEENDWGGAARDFARDVQDLNLHSSSAIDEADGGEAALELVQDVQDLGLHIGLGVVSFCAP